MDTAPPPLHGLLLAGGRSARMQRDKAALEYAGRSQLERAMELLAAEVQRAFVSVRADQQADPLRGRYAQIVDAPGVAGPLAGIVAAQTAQPQAAWLVLACDLPRLDGATLRTLAGRRNPARLATAFRSAHDGMPEPLCAIWEPGSRAPLAAFLEDGGNCPRRFLIRSAIELLDPPPGGALDNINTPAEYGAVRAALGTETARTPVTVQYYAILREQAGRSEERLETVAGTPGELYAELRARHGFTLPAAMLRVAVNGDFAGWAQPLSAGDDVVFIPPVAGG